MSDQEIELQDCEHCGKMHGIGTMTMMSDCWFCEDCYKEWKAEFAACDHHWTPEESEFGEPGQYCDKCSGFRLLPEVSVASCSGT